VDIWRQVICFNDVTEDHPVLQIGCSISRSVIYDFSVFTALHIHSLHIQIKSCVSFPDRLFNIAVIQTEVTGFSPPTGCHLH
jgi:hypothetical protein